MGGGMGSSMGSGMGGMGGGMGGLTWRSRRGGRQRRRDGDGGGGKGEGGNGGDSGGPSKFARDPDARDLAPVTQPDPEQIAKVTGKNRYAKFARDLAPVSHAKSRANAILTGS